MKLKRGRRKAVWLLWAAALLAVAPWLWAERVPIPRRLIDEAVERAAPGWNVTTLELPAPTSASEEQPQLMVDQVKVDASRNWLQARVHCRTTEICLPFYVRAALSPATERALPVEGPVRAAGMVAAGHAPWLVRVGKPATLVASGERVRLTMPVECLENGAQGERVRVRSATGAIYEADVVGAGRVSGELRGQW